MKLRQKKIILYLTLILSFVALMYSHFILGELKDTEVRPKVENGILNCSQWDFEAKGTISLNGEWELYWEQLLEPQDFKVQQNKKDYITLPSELTQHISKDSNGYGTLRIKVLLKDINTIYGLKINYFASANKVWINGEPVASTGIVATNEAEYKAQYLPKEVLFKSDKEEVDIVIQIANFHHRRIKLSEVVLGTADQIKNLTYLKELKEAITFGSLIVIALYYGILSFIQNREKTWLYLSIISLVVAIRGSIVSERILIRLIPNFPPEIMMKLGYLPTFVLLGFLLLYIKEIFQSSQLDKIATISKYAILIIAIVVILTRVSIYDYLFQYIQWLNVLVGIYIVYLLVSNKLFQKTRGSYTMAVGGGVVLLAAINDILREFDIIQTPETLSIATVFFILLQALFLAWRLNDSYMRTQQLAEENEIMYEEIQFMNKELEDKIKQRTKALELANSKLEALTKIDPLTGLANRRYFDEELQREWHRSLREQTPLTLFMIDIDFFKGYNDTYGHLAGDESLKKIAKEIDLNVRRKTDIVSRYGGEEFVVLLPNTNVESGLFVAEKIRNGIRGLQIDNNASTVNNFLTVSIGISTIIAAENHSPKEFINSADKALYDAKNMGRDRIELATDTGI